MSGRYSQSASFEVLRNRFGLDLASLDIRPRYNIAPGQVVPLAVAGKSRYLKAMRWGLIPSWVKDFSFGEGSFNVRAETLMEKTSFKSSFQKRRCLVLADGFYEWEKQGRTRLPHYVTLKSRAAFFFAGLWEPERADTPAAFAIVTTAPNALLQPIHDRMPVMLGPNSGPAWLGDEPLAAAQLARLGRPLRADLMTSHRVDPQVNNVRYEAPDCIASI